MVALRMDPEQPLLRHVVRGPDAYLVPKRDGRLIIGATSEEMGFDDEPTAGGIYELLRGAYEVLPGTYELPLIDIWTGFRPGSRDNGPILGPSPVDGLHFCTGHYRNGIQQTPISVTHVADRILGHEGRELDAFSIHRFLRSR